nr:MAG TPA: Plasmid maintenance system antidote protein [Caudoviricetes sp.]
MPTEYKPNYCFHLGVYLKDDMETLRISVRAASRITGLPKKTIKELIDGKIRIDEAIAAKLELLTGEPAYFWLGVQEKYDEWMNENGSVKD